MILGSARTPNIKNYWYLPACINMCITQKWTKIDQIYQSKYLQFTQFTYHTHISFLLCMQRLNLYKISKINGFIYLMQLKKIKKSVWMWIGKSQKSPRIKISAFAGRWPGAFCRVVLVQQLHICNVVCVWQRKRSPLDRAASYKLQVKCDEPRASSRSHPKARRELERKKTLQWKRS